MIMYMQNEQAPSVQSTFIERDPGDERDGYLLFELTGVVTAEALIAGYEEAEKMLAEFGYSVLDVIVRYVGLDDLRLGSTGDSGKGDNIFKIINKAKPYLANKRLGTIVFQGDHLGFNQITRMTLRAAKRDSVIRLSSGSVDDAEKALNESRKPVPML